MSEEFVLGGAQEREDKEFPVIPEDTTLELEVLKAEKKTKPYKDDNGNPVVRVEFEFRIIEDGEYRNQRAWGETSTAFVKHPECRLFSWVTTILDVTDPDEGFRFTLDDLLTLKVRGVFGVKNYTKKDGTPGSRNFVAELLPFESNFRASAPAAAPAPMVPLATPAPSRPIPASAPTPIEAPVSVGSVADSFGATEFGEEPF